MSSKCCTQAAKHGSPLLATCVTATAVGDVLHALRTHNSVLAHHPYAEMYASLRVCFLPAALPSCPSHPL